MNKKRLTMMVAGTALAALSLACSDTGTTTTTTNANTTASNTAVVVNNNGNTNTAAIDTTNSNSRYNANITRAEYDKDKDRYAQEAKTAGGTIGQGAEDGWLWTKTRSSLMTTDDLRESTINVDVNNSVVTLKGTVANAAQKAKAESVTKALDGVKGVKNELKVQPNDSMMNTNGNHNANTNMNHNMNANANRKG